MIISYIFGCLGFIVFSNLGNVNAQRKNEQLASLFIKDTLVDEPPHITRNTKNQITGFELNGDRVMHLKFVKTN